MRTPELTRADLAGTALLLSARLGRPATEREARGEHRRREVDAWRKDHGRNGQRTPESLDSLRERTENGTDREPLSREPDPARVAEARDLGERIVLALSAHQRTVLLRRARGDSVGSIARDLGIAESTVYVHHLHARAIAALVAGG